MSTYNNREKIRPFIYAFSIYMVTMLLQTASSNVGTIITFFSIMLTIGLYFLEVHFLLPKTKVLFFFFLFGFIVFFNMIIRGYIASNFPKLMIQMLLCAILYGANALNTREEMYLKNAFLCASTFYAFYVIYVGVTSSRGYHGDIVLWGGTSFDPNFIGMPFVVSSVICLYFFTNSKMLFIKRMQYIMLFILFAITIMFTASRGNFLAFIIANTVLILFYIGNSEIIGVKKILVTILTLAICFLLISKLEIYFPDAWSRMLSIGESGSDNGRFELWKIAINWWKQYPIIGGGLFSNYLVFGHAVHNTYLEILSETGLWGASVLYGLYFMILKKSLKYNKMYSCMLIGLMIQMFFLDALDNRVVWVILSWLVLLPKTGHRERKI